MAVFVFAGGILAVKIRKIVLICVVLVLLCIAFSGCVPGDGTNSTEKLAGFFSGIWHGWVAPISLIISIFNKDIGIYEIHNNGLLYNLGFYMAVISGFGGLAIFRKKKSRHSSHN